MAFPRAPMSAPRSNVLRPHLRPLLQALAPLALDPNAYGPAVVNSHSIDHVNVAAPSSSRTTSNDGWRPSAREVAAERALHSHVEVF